MNEEETRLMLLRYRHHLAGEPRLPHSEVPPVMQEVMAEEYRVWHRAAGAFRTLLFPRLLDEAMARLDREAEEADETAPWMRQQIPTDEGCSVDGPEAEAERKAGL